MVPTAEPPGPASGAFRSVASPHRTGEYASGPLGREMPQPQDLAAPRDGTMVNKVGWWSARRSGHHAFARHYGSFRLPIQQAWVAGRSLVCRPWQAIGGTRPHQHERREERWAGTFFL